MSVTHSTGARDAATNAVIALLGANSKLCFRLAGTIGAPGAIAATLLMETSAAPFNASSGGTASAKPITTNTNCAGNASPVATASLQTSADVLHIHCAVAGSASDINLTNGLTIAAGDTVSVSSLTYTALSA